MQEVSKLRRHLHCVPLTDVSKSFFVPCFPVSQTKFQLYSLPAENITNAREVFDLNKLKTK